jgi:hypothetical protein
MKKLNWLLGVGLVVAITLFARTEYDLQVTKDKLDNVNVLADSLILEGIYKDYLIKQITNEKERTN